MTLVSVSLLKIPTACSLRARAQRISASRGAQKLHTNPLMMKFKVALLTVRPEREASAVLISCLLAFRAYIKIQRAKSSI